MSKYYFAVNVETDGLNYDETGRSRKCSTSIMLQNPRSGYECYYVW